MKLSWSSVETLSELYLKEVLLNSLEVLLKVLEALLDLKLFLEILMEHYENSFEVLLKLSWKFFIGS